MTRLHVITCPRTGCGSTNTDEYGEPCTNPNLLVDDAACVRCHACGHTWATCPGADQACTVCGGSGTPGAPGGTAPAAVTCPCYADR